VVGIRSEEATQRRWYAVRAQPRKEAIASLHLRRQGFTTFLPLIEKVVRHPTRTATTSVPFFPSYLFVALSLGHDRWRSVNGTIGVQRLVSFGDQPAPAPAGLIEQLFANSSDKGLVNFDESFAPGAQVRIVGGPFNGLLGTFLKATDSERVSILMTMLAREVTVKVPKAAVTAA
jgi:transcription elongation factor/antiterminator RfaH